MVNSEDMVKGTLYNLYINTQNRYHIKDASERHHLLSNSKVVESYIAYKAFKEINGGVEQSMEDFMEEYCRNIEKRHKYRCFLGSVQNGGKYKNLVFKFADARNLMRNRETEDWGLNQFKIAVSEFFNTQFYDVPSAY